MNKTYHKYIAISPAGVAQLRLKTGHYVPLKALFIGHCLFHYQRNIFFNLLLNLSVFK